MKKVYFFIYVLIGLTFSFNQLLAGAGVSAEFPDWQEVSNISAIEVHAKPGEPGVFLIDADEVLFTSFVNTDGNVSLVRLYQDLEALFSAIRKNGHKVYILTYNKAEEIRQKLSKVGLDESYFDGILACEMTGDVLTSKGDLLRRHLISLTTPYTFAVFIDNFPPFVLNVQNVSKEFGLPLHSYLSTGHIPLYREYVYYHLNKLQQDLKSGKDVAALEGRISKSLEKYDIDIATFSDKFSTFNKFLEFAVKENLDWPYLVYL